MKKTARKPAKKPVKKPTKKPAPKKPAAKKSENPFDEDGVLLRRIEAQIFHAEDREEGEEDSGEDVSERTIKAVLDPGGELSFQGFERDTSPRIHGDRDDEERTFSITIPPHAVPRLAYELVRERFKDSWHAEQELAAFCEEHGIPFETEES